MTTLILVSDVTLSSTVIRESLESLEGFTFKNMEALKKVLPENAEWYTLSDFTTMCNDDKFSVQNVFIAYVNIMNYSFEDTYTICGT